MRTRPSYEAELVKVSGYTQQPKPKERSLGSFSPEKVREIFLKDREVEPRVVADTWELCDRARLFEDR